MRGARTVLIALLAATLALAACGEDESGGSDETISKDEFIERADQICAESGDAQAEIQAELEAATSPDEAAAAYEELADVAQSVNDEIDALGRPEGDEELIDDLAAQQDELVTMVRDLAAAIREQDQAAVESIGAELDALSAETGEISERYGLEVC